MQTDDLTIRVQTLNGTWETLGSERYAGVVPENVTLTSNQWGSDTANFTLKRDEYATSPDLLAFSPIEVEVGGVLVWSGRILETPSQGPADGLAVSAQGWQYHLDDTLYAKTYVHVNLRDWQDIRSFPTVDLTGFQTGGVVNSDGALTIGYPNGATWPSNAAKVGVAIDLGSNVNVFGMNTGFRKRVIVNCHRTAGVGNGAIGVYGQWSPSPSNFGTGGTGTLFGNPPPVNAVNLNSISTSNTQLASSTSSSNRYLTLYMQNLSTGYTVSASDNNGDVLVITDVEIFAETAYESGGTSALKAPVVISDAAAKAALLSTDTSLVDPTGSVTFLIPELDFAKNPQTPRQVIEAVNAYHNYQAYVDVFKRIGFRPRPSTAIFGVGSWPGSQFRDTSLNSGAEIYDNAVVTGTDAAGQFFIHAATSSRQSYQLNPLTTQWGFTRFKQIDVQNALTTAAALQLEQAFLTQSASTPFKGDLTVWQGGCRRLGGAEVHPSQLLLGTGELITLSDRVDPTTGALGRDGRIDTVTYTHNDRKASVSLDNTRKNFDVYLARLQALTANIPNR